MSNPGKSHWRALNRIWGYLKQYLNKGIYYTTKNNIKLLGYSDALWADDLISRRSTTGYIYYFSYNNPISWYSTT